MIEQAACGPDPKMPWWARLLGARYWHGDGSVRTKIGEISYRYRGLAFDFGSYGEPHLHLGLVLFAIFVPLPRWTDRFFRGENSIERDRYGFSWRWGSDGSDLHLHWGQRTRIIWMPWMLEHIRSEYLGSDGQWWDDRAEPDHYSRSLGNPRNRYVGPDGPAKWSETYPYSYLLRSGEVQRVNAIVTRGRSMHGRRWFGTGRLSRTLRRILPVHRFDSLDIRFDGEVGERAGSWKGGTIGCSYAIKAGETPRACVKRMQDERIFR